MRLVACLLQAEALAVKDPCKAADCGDDGAIGCSGCLEFFKQTGGEVFAVAEPEYTELSWTCHDAGFGISWAGASAIT